MLFNTAPFIFFFAIVALAYYGLAHRGRLLLLLAASCYFYMFWIPKYVLILFFVIAVDYCAGIGIERAESKRVKRLLLVASLTANLGVLAFFKYTNFFLGNLNSLGAQLGEKPLALLDIVLPIGLSFHTFQAMSYTIEVYRGNYPAERNLLVYALYVLYFPQLVAGPIERPYNLLPQLSEFHPFAMSNLRHGLVLMVWGMFKKAVIADRLALAVDPVYADPSDANGITLLAATICFAFQIYCDFSGYTDIARGAARVLGVRLMENFRNPYLAQSIGEFWQRWHISLSSWFRDYVYIPLGGNRVSPVRWAFNILAVFGLSGLWHGAGWNYVVWGLLHGSYLIAGRAAAARTKTLQDSGALKALRAVRTFALATFAWIFFRASSFDAAMTVIRGIAGLSFSETPQLALSRAELFAAAVFVAVCLGGESKVEKLCAAHGPKYWTAVGFGAVFVYLFGVFKSNQFIYFQF